MEQKYFIFGLQEDGFTCFGEWDGKPIPLNRYWLQEIKMPEDVHPQGEEGYATWGTRQVRTTLKWNERGWTTYTDVLVQGDYTSRDEDATYNFTKAMTLEEFWDDFGRPDPGDEHWVHLFWEAPPGLQKAMDCLAKYDSKQQYIAECPADYWPEGCDKVYFDTEVKRILSRYDAL